MNQSMCYVDVNMRAICASMGSALLDYWRSVIGTRRYATPVRASAELRIRSQQLLLLALRAKQHRPCMHRLTWRALLACVLPVHTPSPLHICGFMLQGISPLPRRGRIRVVFLALHPGCGSSRVQAAGVRQSRLAPSLSRQQVTSGQPRLPLHSQLML